MLPRPQQNKDAFFIGFFTEKGEYLFTTPVLPPEKYGTYYEMLTAESVGAPVSFPVDPDEVVKYNTGGDFDSVAILPAPVFNTCIRIVHFVGEY